MNYIKQLNSFFELAKERKVASSDQLIYLHLLNLANRANWQETIQATDKELNELTQLSAHSNTITNAKARLKLKGFIDFKNNRQKHCTDYRIIPLYEDKEMPCERPKSQNSPEILKTWREVTGENVSGAMAFYLIEFENQYGAEKLKKAIIDAAKGNKYDHISYNFLKAVLENKGGRNSGTAEQYSSITDDEIPDGY